MIPMSRVQRRLIITLFVVSSLNSAAMIASFVLTPIISYSLSGRVQLIGLPNALSMVGRAGAGYPLGWLLDKAGRRIGLAVGLSFVIFGMLVSASAISAGSLAFFLGGAVLLGVGRAALEQTRYAAAEIFPLAQQAKVIGMIVFAGTVGAVGGPLLVEPAVGLARQQGFHEHVGPFWIGAALMAVALVLLLVALRPDPKELAALLARESDAAKAAEGPEGGPQVEGEEAPRGLRQVMQLLKLPDVQLAMAAMAIGQLVMTLLMVVTPLHMNRADYKADAISYVLMAHTLGMFGLSGLSGWLAGRVGRVPMIFAGALVQVLAAITMPLSTELPVLFVSLFLLGTGVELQLYCRFLVAVGGAGRLATAGACAGHQRGNGCDRVGLRKPRYRRRVFDQRRSGCSGERRDFLGGFGRARAMAGPGASVHPGGGARLGLRCRYIFALRHLPHVPAAVGWSYGLSPTRACRRCSSSVNASTTPA